MVGCCADGHFPDRAIGGQSVKSFTIALSWHTPGWTALPELSDHSPCVRALEQVEIFHSIQLIVQIGKLLVERIVKLQEVLWEEGIFKCVRGYRSVIEHIILHAKDHRFSSVHL